jgi:hypothetical protein
VDFYVGYSYLLEKKMPINTPLENIKAQANRLARIQKIQLSEAYKIISWAFYHCPNYQDLRSRLDNSSVKSRWFELAKITNDSPASDFSTFTNVIPVLVDRLSSRLLCNTNRQGMIDLIYRIFDLSECENSFNMLFPSFSTNGWKPLSQMSPTSKSILVSHIKINGVLYRLLAVNMFMPQHWPFKEEEYCDIAQGLAPTTPSEFRIFSGSKQKWTSSVYDYIVSITDDTSDEYVEFEAPVQSLTKQEIKAESSIQELLEIVGVGDWASSDDSPVPFTFEGDDMALNTYLIFGYPVSEKNSSFKNQNWMISPEKCLMNDSQIVLIDNHPVSVEWISTNPQTFEHDGEYIEHFQSIKNLLTSQDEFTKTLNKQENDYQLMFFKPADIERMRWDLELKPHIDSDKESWLLKVENSQLAEIVLNKISNLDLFVHQSKFGHDEIICKIKILSTESINFSLSLEVKSNNSERYVSLTTGMSSHRNNDEVTLFVTVSPSLINIIELIGKSKLIQSMKNGLINHVDLGFFDQIDNFDQSIIEGLKKLPEDESNMLNSFELPEDFLSNPFSFIDNSRMAQYERQSF